MLSFTDYLFEAQNKHMEHLEDQAFDNGIIGVTKSIQLLRAVWDTLSGTAGSPVDITVKWDGCVSGDTIIVTNLGEMTMKSMFNLNISTLSNILVKGFDMESGKVIWTPVLATNYNPNGTKQWVKLTIKNGASSKFTEDHPVYTTNRGWVAAGILQESDNLFSTKTQENVVSVVKIKAQPQYDISTKTQNFFIKMGETLILVHNSPAVFAGIDPQDGKFFVGTKSIFNKTPKLLKTPEDIKKFHSGGLADKMQIALKYLSKVGIKDGVIQGDFLYTKSDLKTEKVGGQLCYVFHPNTIAYAVPVKSNLGKQIKASKMGIVWHTQYSGSDLASMSATFGNNIADHLKQTPDVWQTDATFRDMSGTVTMTSKESKEFHKLLQQAEQSAKRLKKFDAAISALRGEKELIIRIKTFNNSYIRRGESISDARKHAAAVVTYIRDYYQAEADKRKTEKGRQVQLAKYEKFIKILGNVKKAEATLAELFVSVIAISAAKQIVVKKLDNIDTSVGTFVLTKNGYRVTGREGYVAIDHDGSAVKLVDRLEFSYANFSPDIIKGFEHE